MDQNKMDFFQAETKRTSQLNATIIFFFETSPLGRDYNQKVAKLQSHLMSKYFIIAIQV